MDAGDWVRSIRNARRISQRELAQLANVPRSTIDRIESGRTTPRLDTFLALLAATGYELAVQDRHGRPLLLRRTPKGHYDRADRRFPAHLPAGKTPGYFSDTGHWWGWERIAWPFRDDWVPENTYWRRADVAQFTGRDLHLTEEIGRVWDDAT